MNRVRGYSISVAPQCGKCGQPLHEPFFIKVRRFGRRWKRAFASLMLLAMFGSPLLVALTTSRERPVIYLPTPASVDLCVPTTKPKQGDYLVYNSAPRVSSLNIDTVAGSDYLVKFMDALTNRPVISFFINGGSPFSTEVQAGTFVVKYANGSTWCGSDGLFGANASFSKGAKEINIDRDHDYSLYLRPQRNGNFPTVPIRRSEF